jgi:hypothetical protein
VTDKPDSTKPETTSTDGAKDQVQAPETTAKKDLDLWRRLLHGQAPTDAVRVQTAYVEPIAEPGSQDIGAPAKKPKIETVAERVDATGKTTKLSTGDVIVASTSGDRNFTTNLATGTQTFIGKALDGHITNKAMETIENGLRAYSYDMMSANSQRLSATHIGNLAGQDSRVMTTTSLHSIIEQSIGSEIDLLKAHAATDDKHPRLLSAIGSAGFENNNASVMMGRDDHSLIFGANNELFALDSQHHLKKRDQQTGEFKDLTDAERLALHVQALTGGGVTVCGMTVSADNGTVTDQFGHELTRDASGVLRVVEKDGSGRSLVSIVVDGLKSVATDVRTKAQYVADFANNAFYGINGSGTQLFSFDNVAERFVAGDPNHPDVVFGPDGTVLWNHSRIDRAGNVTLADGEPLTGPGSTVYAQIQAETAMKCANATSLLTQITGSPGDASLLPAIRTSLAELGSIMQLCAAVNNSQAEQAASNAYIHLQLAESRISNGESDGGNTPTPKTPPAVV